MKRSLRRMHNSSKLARINKDFEDDFRNSARRRIENRIDKELRSMPELTNMMRKTPSYRKMLKELETIPKQEDLLKDLWKL